MKRSELLEIVAEVLELEADELTPETVLEDVETFDSVNILNLMVALDESAGVRLDYSDVDRFKVYKDIVVVVVEKGLELTDG